MNSKKISRKDIEDIRKRCNGATKGPWISYVEGRDFWGGSSVITRGRPDPTIKDLELIGAEIEDFDFIAHARQDIPLLLAEIKRLQRLCDDHHIPY